MKLETIIARYRLGLLASDELPAIAARALAADKDSPSLRRLAGTDAGDTDEIRRLFEKCLRELGLAVLSQDEAGLVVAKSIAHEVLSGALKPYDGAKRIWGLYAKNPNLHGLRSFVGLASEYEDDPQNRSGYENEIAKACQSLIESLQ